MLGKQGPAFVPSVKQCILNQQYGLSSSHILYHATKSSRNFIYRLQRCKILNDHRGCVNTLAWNNSGNLLLSGSDDHLLNIYDIYSEKLVHSIESGHNANIFSAKFLPCTSDLKVRCNLLVFFCMQNISYCNHLENH